MRSFENSKEPYWESNPEGISDRRSSCYMKMTHGNVTYVIFNLRTLIEHSTFDTPVPMSRLKPYLKTHWWKKGPEPGRLVTGHRREMVEWRRKTESSHTAVSKDYNFDLFKSGICYAAFADKRFFSHATPWIMPVSKTRKCRVFDYKKLKVVYPLKIKIELNSVQRSSPYRAVNSHRPGYKNQAVNTA